jgi:hypothetical protein
MKTLNKKLIAMAVVALAALATSNAYAAPAPSSLSTIITDPSALDGGFNFVNFKGKSVTMTYSGATPVRIAAGEDFKDQSYSNVGSILKTVFGAGNWTSGGDQLDSAGGGSVASFVSQVTYNYLAVHLGGTEVFFDFGQAGVAAGKTLNFTTTGQGFSNFRAYSDLAKIVNPPTTSTVPVPGAVWLFGSGLVGLVGMRKRTAAAALTA